MKRKDLAALVLAVIAAVSLAACGSSGKKSEKLIGICLNNGEDPAVADCQARLEEMLLARGYQVSVADCRKDQSEQLRQIDSFISQGAAGLIIIPCMTAAAEEFLEPLRAADIPAVLFRREVEEGLLQSCGRVAYVGSDGAQAGALQGQLILSSPNRGDLNGDGVLSYVLLQGEPERIDTLQRTESLRRGLAGSGPVPQELGTVCCGGEQEKARRFCARLLEKYGQDIEAVICNDDVMALGALEAITEAGRTVGGDILLAGIGGASQALEKIRDGAMTGTVTEDPANQAETAVRVLERLMAGAPVEKINYVDHQMITPESQAGAPGT